MIVHLLVLTDHGWHVHCGASTFEAVVPLSLRQRVTCAGCQQWPHPAGRAHALIRSATAQGETLLAAGLPGRPGNRPGGKMTRLEYAYSLRLQADPLVLAWWYEPMALALPGHTLYWPDFRVITSPACLEWHEVKARRKGAAEAIYGYWASDARIKWRQAVERYPMDRFVLAIGWRTDGVYYWQVQAETTA